VARNTHTYLHILVFSKKVPTEGIKHVHGFLNQVASQTPHVAKHEAGTDQGMELLSCHGDVHVAMGTNEEGLKERAECLYSAHD
jgi:hypothetical protein